MCVSFGKFASSYISHAYIRFAFPTIGGAHTVIVEFPPGCCQLAVAASKFRENHNRPATPTTTTINNWNKTPVHRPKSTHTLYFRAALGLEAIIINLYNLELQSHTHTTTDKHTGGLFWTVPDDHLRFSRSSELHNRGFRVVSLCLCIAYVCISCECLCVCARVCVSWWGGEIEGVGEEKSFVFGDGKGNTSTPLERSNTTAGLGLRERFCSWVVAFRNYREASPNGAAPPVCGEQERSCLYKLT